MPDWTPFDLQGYVIRMVSNCWSWLMYSWSVGQMELLVQAQSSVGREDLEFIQFGLAWGPVNCCWNVLEDHLFSVSLALITAPLL